MFPKNIINVEFVNVYGNKLERVTMEPVYSPVQTEDIESEKKVRWKYVLRQVFISSGPWSMFFMTGLCFGTPTVMIPQLRKEANSTEFVSDGMASWLSSVYGYASLPWALILPILSEVYGRKIPYFITFIVTVIGYLIWYFSTSVVAILIAEITVAILICSCVTVAVIIIAEYASPRYRGVLLTIKSASFFWGIWVANTIGTFFKWRIIVILGLFCTAYNASSIFWPESPYWLATQGRFEECSASHRWLRGTCHQEDELELQKLIMSQKKCLSDCTTHTSVFSRQWFTSFAKVFSLKIVYKSILISLTCLSLYHLSGKLACSMYAIEILKKVTGDESTAYKGMLILDGVSIVGMYFGCYLAKKIKRRTLLFGSTSCSILFLFMLSLYLYLIKLDYLNDNSIVSITLLTLFSISISCGPMVLASSISAELMPLNYKGYTIIGINVCNNIILSTVLKISPFIFKNAGSHGGFLFYGICSSVCLIILYKVLPETKDKSMVEIEEHFMN